MKLLPLGIACLLIIGALISTAPQAAAYSIGDAPWALSTISTVSESGNTINGVAFDDSTWVAVSCGTTGLFLYKTTNAGNTWTRTTITTSTTLACGTHPGNQTKVEMKDSQNVFVVYADRAGAGTDRLKIALSTDGGIAFSITNLGNRVPSGFEIGIETASLGFVCAVMPNDAIRVWRNAGAGFSSTNVSVAATLNTPVGTVCDIDSDGASAVLLSTNYYHSADGGRDRGEIFKSDNQGATFGSVLIHSSSAGTDSCGFATPTQAMIQDSLVYRVFAGHESDVNGPTCTSGVVCAPGNGAQVTCLIMCESGDSGATWTCGKFVTPSGDCPAPSGTVEFAAAHSSAGSTASAYGAVSLGQGGFLLLTNCGSTPNVWLRENGATTISHSGNQASSACAGASDGYGFDYVTNKPLIFMAVLSGTDQGRLCTGTTPSLAAFAANTAVRAFCPFANVANFGYNFKEGFTTTDGADFPPPGFQRIFLSNSENDNFDYLALRLDGNATHIATPASVAAHPDGHFSRFLIAYSLVPGEPSGAFKGNGATTGAFFQSMQVEFEELSDSWQITTRQVVDGTATTLTTSTLNKDPNIAADWYIEINFRSGNFNISESGVLQVASTVAPGFVNTGIESVWYVAKGSNSVFDASFQMSYPDQRAALPDSMCVLDYDSRAISRDPLSTQNTDPSPGVGEPGGFTTTPAGGGTIIAQTAKMLGVAESSVKILLGICVTVGAALSVWASTGRVALALLGAGAGFFLSLALGYIPIYIFIGALVIAAAIIVLTVRRGSGTA